MKFLKSLSIFLILLFGLALTACQNDGSDDSTGTISGTYKGTFIEDKTTCYIYVYFNSNYTWYSQGYSDANYSTTSNKGTIPPTAVTTDDFATLTLSGSYSGSLTRQ